MLLLFCALTLATTRIALTSELQPRTGVSANANCPADDGQLFTDPDGYTYNLTCNANCNVGYSDFLNVQQNGFEACIKFCSDYNLGNPTYPCTGVAANTPISGGMNCYLKSAPTYTFESNIYFDCANIVDTPDSTPVTPISDAGTCPGDDRGFYTDSEGVEYEVLCGVDTFSNVLTATSTTVNSYGDCAQVCSDYSATPGNPSCNAFTYDSSSGACLTKTGFIQTNPGSNLNLGFLARTPSNTCRINSTSETILSDEGSTYTLHLLSQPNAQQPLAESTQDTACACVEQCEQYNEQVSGPSQPECKGVEYNPHAPGSNCVVIST